MVLKIKWQSFNYFSVIGIYADRAAKANCFAENRSKKLQLVADLCQLKSNRSFFRDENFLLL